MDKIHIHIKCPRCNKTITHEIQKKDLMENQCEERDMGFSIEYSLSYPIQCPHCGADLDIEVFEYPEDKFDTTATEL